ncbi:MAG: serine/threonine protein kinase [Alphaproteobacteria bacterium]|nr:serine/threonine protein kinase [Alphaproteobacteria bacterium]
MSFPHTISDGRYTLVEPLGVGGMATVFKARDQRLQVWRAIKILSPQYSNRPSLKDRFETEARTTALLEHRHIVKVYDVGRSNGQPYIVMELVQGGNLVDWVKRHGAMPPRMAAEVTIQVCAGVSAAHAKKVVHRDIKPHNVLITSDGTCLITDFGIARVGDDSGGLTRTGAVFGTWAYMAPEQRADAKKVDARADVYSLGATLYFLLTSRTPVDLFAAEKDPTVMEDIDETIKPLLITATQYKRSDRYNTVDDFAAALRDVLDVLPPDPEETPTLAQPAPPPEQLRGGARAIPNAAGGVTLLPPEGDGPSNGTLVPGGEGGGINIADFAKAGIIQPMMESEEGAVEVGGSNYLPLITDLPPSDVPDDEPLDVPEPYEDSGIFVAPPSQVVVSRGVLLTILLSLVAMLMLVGIQLWRDQHRVEPEEVVEGPPPKPDGPELPKDKPTEVDPVDDSAGSAEPDDSAEGPGEGPSGPAVVEAGGKPETPPTPTGPPKGTVVVSGEADEVSFLKDGRTYGPGSLVAGSYKIRATFGGASVPAGDLTVRPGQTINLFCSSAAMSCIVR